MMSNFRGGGGVKQNGTKLDKGFFLNDKNPRIWDVRFLQTCPTPLSDLVQFYLIPLKLDIIYVRSLSEIIQEGSD